MRMEILLAKPEDCHEIIQLQKLAYASEAKLYNDWSLPPLTQTLESLRQEFETSIILKAVIISSVRAKLADDICQIGRLIVHPNFQRQGIGSVLLREIEQQFTQASTYELFTGSKSEANIRLYVHHGYAISRTKELSETLTLTYLTKVALKNYSPRA
jgi:ribosomal protein S18 acetylase RimI-like enzyme